MLGYKALSVDYSKGSGLTHYEYDMTMYGPIFGITVRFQSVQYLCPDRCARYLEQGQVATRAFTAV
jgi:hypothetical protein